MAACSEPSVNDTTLQNVNYGNDNQFGYIFLTREEAKKTIDADQWNGGVNINTIRTAEYVSFGWHYFFKENKVISLLLIRLNSL